MIVSNILIVALMKKPAGHFASPDLFWKSSCAVASCWRLVKPSTLCRGLGVEWKAGGCGGRTAKWNALDVRQYCILVEQIINTSRLTHSLRYDFPQQSPPILYLQYFEL
jgi:hypothetical protein